MDCNTVEFGMVSDEPMRLADHHMCRGVLACIYTKNQIINSKLQDLQNRGSVSITHL